MFRLLSLLTLAFMISLNVPSQAQNLSLDQSPGDYQKDYSPQEGTTVDTNPPPFIWVPPKKDLTYVLQVSSSPDFDDNTKTIRSIPISTYALRETLEPGTWYWRYGVQESEDAVAYSRVREFHVPSSAKSFPYPEMDQVLDSIPEDHPRLFITQDELPSYRQRAKKGDLKEQTQSLLRRCEDYIDQTLVEEPPYVQGTGAERGKHYQQIFRETRPPMDAMEHCALAYLLSGERKYGMEAKRRLQHFFSWDPEGSTSYRNNDEPAMWVMMRGIRAYDWTYNLFTQEERNEIEEVMRIRAQQFYDHLLNRRRFHTNPYESHAGRTLGFLGEVSLAFAHKWPEAQEWLDYVVTLFWNIYPAWGKEDGGWHEGPSYWSYYMSFALHFVVPLRHITEVDLMQKPFFQNTPYYKLYTNPPYANISPFGDGENSGPSRSMGELMYQFSTLLQDPYIRWYAEAMRAGPGSSILGITLKDEALQAKNPSDLPPCRYFPGVGLVSIHTALGHANDDIHFLIHSDPYGAISHAHADQNAFTVEAFGEALAITSGYYPWYGSPHHKNWQWHSRSSNTITFDNGTGQVIRNPKSKGKINDFISAPLYDYVEADASQAYPERINQFIRKVLHPKINDRDHLFIILDELSASKPVSWEWRLHALSELQVSPTKTWVVSQQNQANLRAEFLLPQEPQITKESGFPDEPEHGGDDQYRIIASPKEKAASMDYVVLLVPYREEDWNKIPNESSLEKIEGGYLIHLDYKEENLYFLISTGDHESMNADWVQTDAAIAGFKIDKKGVDESSFFLHEGHFLEVKTTSMVDSLRLEKE